jgi:hypothetical protein
MSFKLKDLKEIAEAKAKEYGKEKDYHCVPTTLMAINDALREVDDVNYADPLVLKAASSLSAGFGTYDAPCGAVTAGSIAIGLKYGTSDVGDLSTSAAAMRRSLEWLQWFKYQKYGSINCFDLRGKPPVFDNCWSFCAQSASKLLEILTEGNPKVIR